MLRDDPEPQFAVLSDRDAEIIEFVLRSNPDLGNDRTYFLTVTPMSDWGEHGAWLTLPDEFHARIGDIVPGYLPASKAYLSNHRVLQRVTQAKAWMKWVTVKRWISENEVEVEAGVWCCPLGGGGGSVIYEKEDGQWHIKEFTGSWVS